MNDKINQHPVITSASELKNICKPLHHFNITYFSHVHIDNDKNFCAIGNNPGFIGSYFRKKYYNDDVHMANPNKFDNFVMWDALDLGGRSNTMHEEASVFGVKHTFTIIEKSSAGSDFYHFANNSMSKSINQVYLANMDLLKKFILYFKHTMHQAKDLARAYDIQFKIDDNASGYIVKTDENLKQTNRSLFIQSVSNDILKPEEACILFHKDSAKPIILAPQQMKCFKLLVAGLTAKEMAIKLNLSYRTINHYLDRLRKILGCRSSKEMISVYRSQIL